MNLSMWLHYMMQLLCFLQEYQGTMLKVAFVMKKIEGSIKEQETANLQIH
jgi:hypothetical protein